MRHAILASRFAKNPLRGWLRAPRPGDGKEVAGDEKGRRFERGPAQLGAAAYPFSSRDQISLGHFFPATRIVPVRSARREVCLRGRAVSALAEPGFLRRLWPARIAEEVQRGSGGNSKSGKDFSGPPGTLFHCEGRRRGRGQFSGKWGNKGGFQGPPVGCPAQTRPNLCRGTRRAGDQGRGALERGCPTFNMRLF